MSAQPAATVTALAQQHGQELLRFAYLLCGDRQRAEDLLQDVLLNLHRRFPDTLTVDNPIGYARRALANANVGRARHYSSTELAVAAFPDVAGVEDDPAERDALWQALRRLPVRQRTVLVLRFYADLADTDIADALDDQLRIMLRERSRDITQVPGLLPHLSARADLIDADTFVITVSGPPPHREGQIDEILIVSATTVERTLVDQSSSSLHTIHGMAVLDGNVYWDEHP